MAETDDSKRIAYKLAVVEDSLKAVINNLIAIGQFSQVSAQCGHATHGFVGGINDLLIQDRLHRLQAAHPNPLNRHSQQCFSQTDEDGITMEIVRRLGIKKGRFAEFGVGNGLENNTIILGALGWSGFWVGGEELAFETPKPGRLHYIKDWITLDNVSRHAKAGLGLLGGGKFTRKFTGRHLARPGRQRHLLGREPSGKRLCAEAVHRRVQREVQAARALPDSVQPGPHVGRR